MFLEPFGIRLGTGYNLLIRGSEGVIQGKDTLTDEWQSEEISRKGRIPKELGHGPR